MANAKNTIQNIPLTGELCLNTLKTDVKAFEGYNEKNSTVFGGELAPVWKKESELDDKEASYTIFNSKGEPFTLKIHYPEPSSPGYYPALYDNNDRITNAGIRLPIEINNCAPDNADWYTFLTYGNEHTPSMFGQIYVIRHWNYDNGVQVYARFSKTPGLSSLINTEYKHIFTFNVSKGEYGYYNVDEIKSVDARLTQVGDKDALLISLVYKCHRSDISGYKYGYASVIIYGDDLNSEMYTPEYNLKNHVETNLLPDNFTETSFTNISLYGGIKFSYVPFTGRKIPVNTDKAKLITLNYIDWESPINHTDEDVNYFYGNNYSSLSQSLSYIYPSNIPQGYTYTVEVWRGDSYLLEKKPDSDCVMFYQRGTYTGHDGNYYSPGLKAGYLRARSYLSFFPDTYIDGHLFAATFMGRIIEQPGKLNDFEYSKDFGAVSFKKNNKWISYVNGYSSLVVYPTDAPLLIDTAKKLAIIDDTFIQLNSDYYFNINTKQIVQAHLDFINCYTPITGVPDSSETGLIYALGNNVNYTISGVPLVGLLYNPIVLTSYPNTRYVGFTPSFTPIPEYQKDKGGIDIYYSLGDNVQSAEYQGKNPEYFGTVYPIDVNGNIMYPITWDSQIINGYSNNDLIKIGDTAYPLIYWNNNQKIYAYYLLSSMENVKGAFALQGQRYVFDDNNIYSATFNNGVVESMNTIAYIKNMQFLGTLPTSAVFYSKFNKTFYQFTGDAILSKMFEASDIDEIKMVGQNPSSLSLWICTDKGIYILSDTDMFKLDYDVSDIYFNDEKTIIVTEGETNWIENDISLYDIGNEATETPIKLQTKFYGLGGELKANYDCWYIRLHNKDRKSGKLKVKVNTITNSSFETEEKTFDIQQCQYDSNNTVFIRYQPKYQSAVATQLELESDIAIYQISLGVNSTDAVAQQSKFNF